MSNKGLMTERTYNRRMRPKRTIAWVTVGILALTVGACVGFLYLLIWTRELRF